MTDSLNTYQTYAGMTLSCLCLGAGLAGKKLKIYVAGPYTQGDPILNIRTAIQIGEEILKLGHTPFVPHMNYTWHFLHPHSHQVWLDWDIEWLKVCDALIRIPGSSAGSDREEMVAREMGIPVFHYKEEEPIEL